MTVQFLLLPFFKTKDDMELDMHGRLSRHGVVRIDSALEDVGSDNLATHSLFDETFFVASHLGGTLGVEMIV